MRTTRTTMRSVPPSPQPLAALHNSKPAGTPGLAGTCLRPGLHIPLECRLSDHPAKVMSAALHARAALQLREHLL